MIRFGWPWRRRDFVAAGVGAAVATLVVGACLGPEIDRERARADALQRLFMGGFVHPEEKLRDMEEKFRKMTDQLEGMVDPHKGKQPDR